MREPHGLPPGRTGQLWLRRRLATAERGAALLDHKVRLLRLEQDRLRARAARTAAAWAAACAEADEWLVRAALLGGQRDIRLATGEAAARVTVEWRQVMGVRYPSSADVTLPADRPSRVPPAGAALGEATGAYERALAAAAEHAVAAEALRVVADEIDGTSHRLRAVTDRWMPLLAEAAHDLAQRLEENERDEITRLRWASRRAQGQPSRTAPRER